MYLSSTELVIIACLGAAFVAWGVALLLLGYHDTATTVLLASLSMLGMYVGYQEIQRSR